MSYDICQKCQRFFGKDGKKYCPKCDIEVSDSHSQIKNYLANNPNSSILEIVKSTGVKLKDVNIFLDIGGASTYTNYNQLDPVSLRDDELKKQKEIIEKRESLKLKNNFKPRRLRR